MKNIFSTFDKTMASSVIMGVIARACFQYLSDYLYPSVYGYRFDYILAPVICLKVDEVRTILHTQLMRMKT